MCALNMKHIMLDYINCKGFHCFILTAVFRRRLSEAFSACIEERRCRAECKHLNKSVSTHTHSYTNIHTQTSIRKHTRAHTNTHIHAQTHTCAYIHTHTYKLAHI